MDCMCCVSRNQTQWSKAAVTSAREVLSCVYGVCE